MMAEKIFDILVDIGACKTQVEFSRKWLGASDRYFSFLLAKQRDPNMTALMSLAARMENLADQLSSDPNYAKQARVLNALIDEVWDYMRARAVATEPKRRCAQSAHAPLPIQKSSSATLIAV